MGVRGGLKFEIEDCELRPKQDEEVVWTPGMPRDCQNFKWLVFLRTS